MFILYFVIFLGLKALVGSQYTCLPLEDTDCAISQNRSTVLRCHAVTLVREICLHSLTAVRTVELVGSEMTVESLFSFSLVSNLQALEFDNSPIKDYFLQIYLTRVCLYPLVSSHVRSSKSYTAFWL